ncbi:hypothetical protein ABZ319_37245 [Nocardia sp. NPDC005978]|uniref:hypothetical protein n=1 Tax=Nocardia sp. NPDC005978 TaxID=3156725 RepID=UPI0033B99580
MGDARVLVQGEPLDLLPALRSRIYLKLAMATVAIVFAAVAIDRYAYPGSGAATRT